MILHSINLCHVSHTFQGDENIKIVNERSMTQNGITGNNQWVLPELQYQLSLTNIHCLEYILLK